MQGVGTLRGTMRCVPAAGAPRRRAKTSTRCSDEDLAMGELRSLLAERFGDDVACDGLAQPKTWLDIAKRGSCRRFRPDKVDPKTLDALVALSFCAPTKSDLQQRDVVVVEDGGLRRRLDALLTRGPLAQPWIAEAPHMLVFLGNNRRQRLVHEWRGRPFVNDHLDSFFNAAVDAGIAMATFVVAAEAAGLGCCPISAIRNDGEAVGDLLGLPPYVFPVAGLAVGWPAGPAKRSMRLPLGVTVHRDRYAEEGVRQAVEAYDRRREAAQPYSQQRASGEFGTAPAYGWSEDKARQYARPERETFGAYVRKQGFRLD
jgi:nitroreductase/FMN reductase [NAD(P)H]